MYVFIAREGSSIVTDSITSDERVREIVKDVLRTYDADKTGRVDYALESAGTWLSDNYCRDSLGKTNGVLFR